MKKPFFITLGVAILLIALGVWLYLFLFGTPSSGDDVFADLGFDISSQPIVPFEQAEFEEDTTLINIEGQPLRQLTVRPVAGFTSYLQGDTQFVRYMERGTGHIYDINLATGEEVRVSNTTYSRVVKAVFGSNAQYVAFQSEEGYSVTTNAGVINTDGANGSLNVSGLPPQAKNLSFTGTSTVHYTLTANVTTGYEFDIATNNQREIFRVPFLSIRSSLVGGSAFVYNRQAPELLGTLYKTNGVDFESLMIQRFGFSAMVSDSWYIYGYTENNIYESEAVSREGSIKRTLPIPFIAEKCTTRSRTGDTLLCAAPFAPISYTYLKDWYQGKLRSNDVLWEVDIDSESATFITDPVAATGREIDVLKIETGANGRSFFMINKNDDTLWYYDFFAS